MVAFLSALAKPFVLLAFMSFCLGLVWLIRRFLPNSWFKRLLLLRLWD
jgi:hypothetical protein